MVSEQDWADSLTGGPGKRKTNTANNDPEQEQEKLVKENSMRLHIKSWVMEPEKPNCPPQMFLTEAHIGSKILSHLENCILRSFQFMSNAQKKKKKKKEKTERRKMAVDRENCTLLNMPFICKRMTKGRRIEVSTHSCGIRGKSCWRLQGELLQIYRGVCPK
jgi:hypothetical protein